MSKQQMDAIAQMLLAADGARPDMPVEEQRAAMEATTAAFPLPDGGKIVADTVGGVACEWQWMGGADESKVLLYFHGGGYVIGSPKTHRSLVLELSRVSGLKALSVDYGLAPENPFPAAVDDALAVYKALLDGGTPAKNVVIAGDSAGGGLSLALMLKIKDEGLPQPAGAALLSPWSDMRLNAPSYESRKDADPMVTHEGLAGMAAHYLGSTAPENPLASPILADLAGLAPMLIHVGDAEILLDDAVILAKNAEAAGADVSIKVWDDMIHVFQAFYAMVDEARESVKEIGAYLAERAA